MTAWIYLFVAGGLEIAWAVALKASGGFSRPLPAVFGVVMAALSLFLLSLAIRFLPASLAYPVWVGIGVAGVTAYGALFLGEIHPDISRKPRKRIHRSAFKTRGF